MSGFLENTGSGVQQPTNLSVKFFRQEGQDYLMCKARDSKEEITRLVKPKDLQAWPREWAQYEASNPEDYDNHGTRLTELAAFDRDTANRLRFKGVHSVEQFADYSDHAAASLSDEHGVKWRNACRDYVELQALRADKAEEDA